ncbi:MAG: hypothetical protein KF861_01775 [Planctomycetaceae bacterium]|nr:hypothetical protein [Planctomycetaceae bacterium]
MLSERAERPETYVTEDSLWPGLAARINKPRHQPTSNWNTKRFTGWMPLVAMTAASFVLLLVVIERPQQPLGAIPHVAPVPSPVISVERPMSDPYAGFPEYIQKEQDQDNNSKLLQELRMRRFPEGF